MIKITLPVIIISLQNDSVSQEFTHKETSTLCKKTKCFYEYFVPNCLAYLTQKINLNSHLANGALVREHSLAFDCIDEGHLMTPSDWHLLEALLNCTHHQLQWMNLLFLTSQAMKILHLNLKQNKKMNGNMDPLQMMGKPSFLLIIANLWEVDFNTIIVCWKNKMKYNHEVTCQTQMNRYCLQKKQILYQKKNMFLWVLWTYCTHNINLNAYLAL